ncbi:hypothetical protein [Sebaldella sp. S0638]|nr:hypothetical protein [Sebaldella sp. S0638]
MKKLVTVALLMLAVTASAFAGSHHGGTHRHSDSCGHTWRY